MLENPECNHFKMHDHNLSKDTLRLWLKRQEDFSIISGGTDGLGKLCYNFSNSVIILISNDLTLMVNFLTRIPDCDSHSPALLDLSLSSDARWYLFYNGFPSIGKF